MSEFGEVCLVLGDLHVPHRKDDLPEKFKALLQTARFHHIVCTGNVGSRSGEEYLRSLSPSASFHIVKGDLDTNSVVGEIPEQKLIKVGDFTILLLHGHTVVPWNDSEALHQLGRQYSADLIVVGHTHQLAVTSVGPAANPLRILNPGSITGSYSAFHSSVSPSFLVLCIKQSSATVFAYELSNANGKQDEVTITKSEFQKRK